MTEAKLTPVEALRRGVEALNPVMRAHGFRYVTGSSGHSSGGDYASGRFVRWNRSLELHFRHELGLVKYRFGRQSLRHEVLMRALLGKDGGNKYPGFSKNPLDAFEDLRYDLENFCSIFLSGDKKRFRQCVAEVESARKLSRLERMEHRWPASIGDL
jgi:hypothetical protein